MSRIVIGAADQALAADLRSLVSDQADAEIVSYAESTHDLSVLAGRERVDVVLVHDRLGPQDMVDVVREIGARAPASSIVVVNTVGGDADKVAALEAGARGVLEYPLDATDFAAKYDAAVAWSHRMGGLISGVVEDTARELGRNGRVTVVAGAKGGVGTTTVATHLAVDLRRRVPGIRVCLVDLDLQSGDVAAIVEARQRVSIADVARVSQDLDSGTIMDALVEHSSGVSLLLAPLKVHESELVTASAVRAMLTLLRQQFHVILVDGGSHPTPAQAAAVELADEVVAVTTPDVLALRSFRRVVLAWEHLGVREERSLNLLVNRVSRADVITTDAIAKLTTARLVGAQLPAAFRWLEKGVNARDPDVVNEATWWRSIEKVGVEVGIHATSALADLGVEESGSRRRRGRPPRGRRGSGTAQDDRSDRAEASQRPGSREAGQIAVETAVLVPVVLLICLLVWQVGLTGLAFVWNGQAANAAARAQSIGQDPAEAARDSVPDSLRDQVSVSVTDDGSVRVATRVPVLCTGCGTLPTSVTQEARAVREP